MTLTPSKESRPMKDKSSKQPSLEDLKAQLQLNEVQYRWLESAINQLIKKARIKENLYLRNRLNYLEQVRNATAERIAELEKGTNHE